MRQRTSLLRSFHGRCGTQLARLYEAALNPVLDPEFRRFTVITTTTLAAQDLSPVVRLDLLFKPLAVPFCGHPTGAGVRRFASLTWSPAEPDLLIREDCLAPGRRSSACRHPAAEWDAMVEGLLDDVEIITLGYVSSAFADALSGDSSA